MDVPDALMGWHPSGSTDMATKVHSFLSQRAGVTGRHGLQYENAGTVSCWSSGSRDPPEVYELRVPLPHLHAADVRVAELEEWLEMTTTKGAVNVEVARPPQEQS